MSLNEAINTAIYMRHHGPSFEKALAEAWYMASEEQRSILEVNFREIFAKYRARMIESKGMTDEL